MIVALNVNYLFFYYFYFYFLKALDRFKINGRSYYKIK